MVLAVTFFVFWLGCLVAAMVSWTVYIRWKLRHNPPPDSYVFDESAFEVVGGLRVASTHATWPFGLMTFDSQHARIRGRLIARFMGDVAITRAEVASVRVRRGFPSGIALSFDTATDRLQRVRFFAFNDEPATALAAMGWPVERR